MEVIDGKGCPEEVIDFLPNCVVQETHLVCGIDLDGHRHSGYLIFTLVLQPRRRLDPLPDLGDVFAVDLSSVLQTIQGILQFANELISQLGNEETK